ncbi:hypothetical protein HHI36_004054 [Cryptolaemus montrouzieri]|uniref:Uncharacterized protein n=1 Tax=Cryptolaemus montrouzieri TaxID=559131 RepID=A0ABD2NQH4_9CUCU
MNKTHVKRVCICEDNTLPIIIKINPCPGRTCPFARVSSGSLITEDSSSSSEYSFSIPSSSQDDGSSSSNTFKTDSSSGTSEGKSNSSTETYDDDRLIVECGAFEDGGKCVNDAQCATSTSIQEIGKVKGHHASQTICVHTRINADEKQRDLEEKIMRNQSKIIQENAIEENATGENEATSESS